MNLLPLNPILETSRIEYAGRNCYRSQDKIADDSYDKFIRMLIKRGHESPLEFGSMSFEILTSRAILAELTRHRVASFCVESQRYVDYEQLTFIIPDWVQEADKESAQMWFDSMRYAANTYQQLRKNGKTPELARSVLPNDTACHIIMSANLREWRHVFKLRTSKGAHPQMRALMKLGLEEAVKTFPCVFEDLVGEENATTA